MERLGEREAYTPCHSRCLTRVARMWAHSLVSLTLVRYYSSDARHIHGGPMVSNAAVSVFMSPISQLTQICTVRLRLIKSNYASVTTVSKTEPSSSIPQVLVWSDHLCRSLAAFWLYGVSAGIVAYWLRKPLTSPRLVVKLPRLPWGISKFVTAATAPREVVARWTFPDRLPSQQFLALAAIPAHAHPGYLKLFSISPDDVALADPAHRRSCVTRRICRCGRQSGQWCCANAIGKRQSCVITNRKTNRRDKR